MSLVSCCVPFTLCTYSGTCSSQYSADESCRMAFRGTTRKWTGACALMSSKATHCSKKRKHYWCNASLYTPAMSLPWSFFPNFLIEIARPFVLATMASLDLAYDSCPAETGSSAAGLSRPLWSSSSSATSCILSTLSPHILAAACSETAVVSACSGPQGRLTDEGL